MVFHQRPRSNSSLRTRLSLAKTLSPLLPSSLSLGRLSKCYEENGGGGCGAFAAIKLADNKRRKRTTGNMAPSSEWRCVALFFNNTAAPANAAAAMNRKGAGVGSSQGGAPVPAAVNSLAWSSLEERLFTADTVGFVKVRKLSTGFAPPLSRIAEEAGAP